MGHLYISILASNFCKWEYKAPRGVFDNQEIEALWSVTSSWHKLNALFKERFNKWPLYVSILASNYRKWEYKAPRSVFDNVGAFLTIKKFKLWSITSRWRKLYALFNDRFNKWHLYVSILASKGK